MGFAGFAVVFFCVNLAVLHSSVSTHHEQRSQSSEGAHWHPLPRHSSGLHGGGGGGGGGSAVRALQNLREIEQVGTHKMHVACVVIVMSIEPVRGEIEQGREKKRTHSLFVGWL